MIQCTYHIVGANRIRHQIFITLKYIIHHDISQHDNCEPNTIAHYCEHLIIHMLKA